MSPNDRKSWDIFVLAVLALLVSTGHCDRLVSSTYKAVETHLLGTAYRHTILEAHYDEELYIRRQWTCGCVNETLPCAANASKSGASLDETGYSLRRLAEGVWVEEAIQNNYDKAYYSFDLVYDPDNPCPELRLEFETKVGTLSAFIGTRQIPNQEEYSWYRPYYAVSSYTICPSHPDFVYGRFYITLVNQGSFHYNEYSMRIVIGKSPRCPSAIALEKPSIEPLLAEYPDAEIPEIWLEDGVAHVLETGLLDATTSYYFKFLAPPGCTNFSAATRRMKISGEGDLFVSVTNPNPRLGSTYEWYGTMDADDFVDVYYCNPDLDAPHTIFYVGVTAYAGDTAYELIATTQHYQPSVALSSLALTQSKLDLALGALPVLDCQTEISTCQFNSYVFCDADINYACCWRLSPLPPSETPNPLRPWSEFMNNIGQYYTNLPLQSYPPSTPGKLAYSLYHGWSNSGANMTYSSVTDVSRCKAKLSGKLEFANGRRLPSLELGFSQKDPSCNLASFVSAQSEIVKLTQRMASEANTASVPELMSLQIDVTGVSVSDAIYGCTSFTQDLALRTDAHTTSFIYSCAWPHASLQWLEDPCCNPELARTVSCRPRRAIETISNYYGAYEKLIKSQCKHAECTNGTITQWAQSSAASSCADVFNQVASLQRLDDLTQFAPTCRFAVEGKDLQGAPCLAHSDCRYSQNCSLETKRCVHTTDDVLQCLIENIPDDMTRILYSSWNVVGPTEGSVLKQRISDSVLAIQCVGPNAMSFRERYEYVPQISSCVDSCLKDGKQPKCFDPSDPVCVIPDECDGGITLGACYRIWSPMPQDDQGCAETKICNWYGETSNPCPYGVDSATCEFNCALNSSLSSHVCLDCSMTSKGSCLEMANYVDEATCITPKCSTNASISNSAECASSGTCSISCLTCNTEAGCNAAGACSSDAEFASLLEGGSTGACIYPAEWTYDSGLYCQSSLDHLTSIGCANTSIVTEQECDYFWFRFPTNPTTCTTNAGSGCYDSSAGAFLPRNESECAICEPRGCIWTPYYTWNAGVWSIATMSQFTWTTRSYSVATTLASSVSYTALNQLLDAAVTRVASPAYRTEALCRYGASLNSIQSVACDCNPATWSGTCFSQIKDTQMGESTACPYLNTLFTSQVAVVYIHNDSLASNQVCSKLDLMATPAAQYELPPNAGVTQALFRGTTTNANWVVKNKKDASVGQILSGGVKLSFDFTLDQPVTLCIDIDPSIQVAHIKDKTLLYRFASLEEDGQVSVMEGLEASRAFVEPISSPKVGGARNRVCLRVKERGTYFAVAVVPDYERVDPRVSKAQYYVGAAFYAVVIVFGIVQAVLLLLDMENQRILKVKLVFIAIILVYAIIRMVYVLLPANAFGKGMDSIQFIIFELPTFLFFSIFSAIAYLWLVVVLKTYYLGRKGMVSIRERQLKLGLGLGNCIMYLIFVLFIYLIAIVPALAPTSPCFYGNLSTDNNRASYRIKLAYWIYQLVMSVLLCVAFSISSLALLRVVLSLRQTNLEMARASMSKRSAKRQTNRSNGLYKQIYIITAVAFICIIFLLIRSAIFLWAAATGNALNVIVFVLLECIPQFMLLFYVHPFRCFREEGRSSSTHGSTDRSHSGISMHHSIIVSSSEPSSAH